MTDQTEVTVGGVKDDFILDANGDALFEDGPALKIEILHALGGKKKEGGFEARVEWITPAGKHVDISPSDSFRKSDGAVWELAWDAARDVIYSAYTDALNGDEALTAIQLHAFRCMILDRLQQKRDELEEKDIVSFTWFSGGDLTAALRILASHFAAIDELVSVAFRFRHSSEGNAWTKGLDEKGAARPCLFRLDACSGEKIHAARLGLGYAPRFVVTVCAAAWAQSSEKARFLTIYDALSRIAWDSEKEKAFICDPIGMTPGLAYEMELANMDSHARRIAEKVAKAMVDGGRQLSLLAGESDGAAPDNEMRRIAAKAIVGMTGGDTTVTISAGGKSVTLDAESRKRAQAVLAEGGGDS